MNVERALRLMAGVVIFVSVALAHYVSIYWLWLTAFVGLNLLQSVYRLVSGDDDLPSLRLEGCRLQHAKLSQSCAART
jgi:hypothetical protein